jgi:hypothetical protein
MARTFFKPAAWRIVWLLTLSVTLRAEPKLEPKPIRLWTNLAGRTLNARLISSPTIDTVKLERDDGQAFTIPLNSLSEADRAYVHTSNQSLKAAPKPETCIVKPATWKTLAALPLLPVQRYRDTPLEDNLSYLNTRFAANGLTTPSGSTLQIRISPASLGSRLSTTVEFPPASAETLIRELARLHHLSLRNDTDGHIVFFDPVTSIEFLGVTVD